MPVLLLDVMDTLVHDPFHQEVPAFFGMSLQRLLGEKHPTAWQEFERGARDEASFLSGYFADGRAYDHQGFKETLRSSYRWLDGVEPLLADLRAARVAMHALSNYPPWFEMIEARLGLSRYLDWTFVSCRTGLRKPAPEAYLGAAGALDVAPAECLFVDDRESNCAAAEEVGMAAIRFGGAAALRAALEARGILRPQ